MILPTLISSSLVFLILDLFWSYTFEINSLNATEKAVNYLFFIKIIIKWLRNLISLILKILLSAFVIGIVAKIKVDKQIII